MYEQLNWIEYNVIDENSSKLKTIALSKWANCTYFLSMQMLIQMIFYGLSTNYLWSLVLVCGFALPTSLASIRPPAPTLSILPAYINYKKISWIIFMIVANIVCGKVCISFFFCSLPFMSWQKFERRLFKCRMFSHHHWIHNLTSVVAMAQNM